MIFGSVCSGIEAASVAWHLIGWRAAWLAEIEAGPSAVLAHHYPDVPNLGDMTKIADMVARGEVVAPDVLVGGTPCQAFSVAGARKGLADDRGFLTIKFLELANAIDEQREQPAVIVWENVPGVLSSKDNAFGCFLAGLAGESEPLEPPGGKWGNAGYVSGPQRAVAWRVLDAQFFGVAQRRRRVFVVASSRDGFDPAAVLFECEGVRRDTAPSREAGKAVAFAAGDSAQQSGIWGGLYGQSDGSEANSDCSGSQKAFPSVVAALTAHGVGTCGADDNQGQAGHLIPTAGFRMVAFGEYLDDGTASTMKARDYKDATDLAVHCIHGTQDPIVSDNMAHCLGRNSGQENAIAYGFQQRIGRNGRGDMGDLVSALTAQAGETGKGDAAPCVAITQFGVEQAGTLTARHDSSPCHDRGQNMVAQQGAQVRRLTPTECERLQGFPDGYTLVPIGKKMMLDGPRYKALGNSMAVPCMAWVGRRIADEVAREIMRGLGV